MDDEYELTDWFPPEVRPVHVGWYDVTVYPGFSAEWRAHWDGDGFTLAHGRMHTELALHWRGIVLDDDE